jgi:hypothetical protein
MSNVALTIQERINLVRSAIEKIRDAEAQLKEFGCTSSEKPFFDLVKRAEARGRLEAARYNWRGQWSNVEVILQEGLREELR